MNRNFSVNLSNLVLSLSDAMDLASPLLAQHQQRTAFIVWEMGKLARFSRAQIESCFVAALLHDIGAFSLEEKIALHKSEVKNTEDHCTRGEILLEKVPYLKDAARIVRGHHDKWEDIKEPLDSPFVLEAQMLHLADYLERLIKRDQYILLQNKDIISDIQALSGTFFHPHVVDLIVSISDREEFWLDLVSPRLYYNFINNSPFRKIEMEMHNITMIAELFRNIIDFRSRYTATHSSGVAAAASMLSRLFGLTDTEVGLMEVAGNFHDIGKLVIPNSILEKPGRLTRDEFAVMRSHTYFTYSILNNIGGLQDIAEWAAYHHEKLDGSGYPFRCKDHELSTGSRILMVADIFTALAEDRPYRKSMPKKDIIKIIKDDADKNLLDKKIADLLFDNFDETFKYVTEKQAVTLDFYQNQFTFLQTG